MIIIQQASPTNFLKILAIIFLIYYVVRFLARMFVPFLIKKMASKMQQKAEEVFGNQQQKQKSTVKEGETVIDKSPLKNKGSNNSVGEYIDFEEVD